MPTTNPLIEANLMSAVISAPITTEQFLALPDDGVERELIRGQLRERTTDRMREIGTTTRNRFHTFSTARIGQLVGNWNDKQPEPRGQVHVGEVGCILRRNPDTTVGIDVAYFSAEAMERQPDDTTLIEGTTRLAVEVLSPSDKLEEIHEKVVEYLRAGVEMIWIVDPYFQTVQVHRPSATPRMYNLEETVPGADVLPGLEVAVRDIFPEIMPSEQS